MLAPRCKSTIVYKHAGPCPAFRVFDAIPLLAGYPGSEAECERAGSRALDQDAMGPHWLKDHMGAVPIPL